MGVDLIGLVDEVGEASFHWGLWRTCLGIAAIFGWQPAGTVKSSDYDGEWNGSYFTNDFQEVTDGDARALGAALHRAIAAVSIGQALTEEQAKALDCLDLNGVRRLADYAASGGFVIG